VFIQNFMGDGTDTTYGAFDVTSTSTVDFSSPPTITIINEMLQEVFAAGSLFGTGSGSGMATATEPPRSRPTSSLPVGQGYLNVSHGTATIMGTITQTGPLTEVISNASYTGTLTSVPEPSSIGLLVLGTSLGYRFLKDRLTRATCRIRDVRGAGGIRVLSLHLDKSAQGFAPTGAKPTSSVKLDGNRFSEESFRIETCARVLPARHS
jgi:hypothetical protein